MKPKIIDAALEFANNIFPLIQREVPRVVFHVVGADPGPRILELGSRPGIKISINLPDLRPAVCSAAGRVPGRTTTVAFDKSIFVEAWGVANRFRLVANNTEKKLALDESMTEFYRKQRNK